MTNFLKLHPDGVLHMTIKLILIVFEGWVNMRLSHGLVTTWSHSMRHSLAIQNYNGHVLKNYHYKELFSKTILVKSHIFFNYLGSVWRARKCSRRLAGALAKKIKKNMHYCQCVYKYQKSPMNAEKQCALYWNFFMPSKSSVGGLWYKNTDSEIPRTA